MNHRVQCSSLQSVTYLLELRDAILEELDETVSSGKENQSGFKINLTKLALLAFGLASTIK